MKRTFKLTFDQRLAFLGLFIGILGILPLVYDTSINIGFIGFMYKFFYLIYYNWYILFIFFIIPLYIYLIKISTVSTLVSYILIVITLSNIFYTIYIMYQKDYSWLLKNAIISEQNRDLNKASVYLKNYEIFSKKSVSKQKRRVYNKLLISNSLFKSYKKSKKSVLSIIAIENLCKAYSLNNKFQEEVNNVKDLEKELDSQYIQALLDYRNGDKNSFIQKISKINYRYKNYGYSNSIMKVMSNKNSKNDLDYYISSESFKKLNSSLLNKELDIAKIINNLSYEFKIETCINSKNNPAKFRPF